jgi:hypothetical protein
MLGCRGGGCASWSAVRLGGTDYLEILLAQARPSTAAWATMDRYFS